MPFVVTRPINSFITVCLTVFFALAAQPLAEAEDWPYWRGPHYDGVAYETGLIEDWDPNGGAGSNVRWQRDDLGTRSSPIVLNGKLYILARAEPGTPREGERVVCLDAQTGATLWESRFNVYLSDVPDTRVAWSSCVGDPASGRVYALGVCGFFQCLDGDTGETLWSYPLHERFGLLSTYGGRTNFPVLCDDLVIVSAVVIGWGEMAKPTHRFIALDKMTGEVVWIRGTRPLPEDTTYSAPVLTVLNRQKALVFGSGDGAVWALQPRTGEKIWNFRLSRRGLNVPPLVVGDTVYMGHSEENIEGTTMGAVVAIDGSGVGDITETGKLWQVDELMAGKSAPLAVDGRLLVIDDRAKLYVLDAVTGDRVGSRIPLGTVMRGSPLYGDGKVYAITANGRWYILAPDEQKGAKKLKSGRLLRGDDCLASPVCANGSIFLATTGRLYCLADDSLSSAAVTPPQAAEEAPLSEDQKPALLQVIPADALLKPGQSQPFRARLFNARGQLLRSVPADFTVSGGGSITAEGVFTAATDGHHTAVTVTAVAEGIAGQARLRIVPPLPWKFDFEDISLPRGVGEPPETWVGCRYRHVIRELDGNKVMVKLNTIPKGTRSRGWFGPSDLSNYTIQADVRGAIQDDKMPDIGIIAQGYAMDLQGENQKLQIRSWVPQLRMAETSDFAWEPNVWYTMKLRAAVRDGKALLQGKVWRRGASEPVEWTIQAKDSAPTLSGSPGLYGNAKDAEIFLDNIEVTPND